MMDRNDAEHSGDSCCNKNKQTNSKTLVTYSEQDVLTHRQKIFAKQILNLSSVNKSSAITGLKADLSLKLWVSNSSKPAKIF